MSGAALRFLQASSWMRRKNRQSAREQASLPRPVAAKARRCLRQKQPSWSRGRGLNFQAHCMRAENSGHRNPDETGRAASCPLQAGRSKSGAPRPGRNIPNPTAHQPPPPCQKDGGGFCMDSFLTAHQCIKLAKTGLVLYKTPKMSCGGLCPLYNRERVGYNPIRYHCIALPQ